MAQTPAVEGAAVSQARSINIKARRISPGFCIQCASFDSLSVKGVPNRALNCAKSCAALVETGKTATGCEPFQRTWGKELWGGGNLWLHFLKEKRMLPIPASGSSSSHKAERTEGGIAPENRKGPTAFAVEPCTFWLPGTDLNRQPSD